MVVLHVREGEGQQQGQGSDEGQGLREADTSGAARQFTKMVGWSAGDRMCKAPVITWTTWRWFGAAPSRLGSTRSGLQWRLAAESSTRSEAFVTQPSLSTLGDLGDRAHRATVTVVIPGNRRPTRR